MRLVAGIMLGILGLFATASPTLGAGPGDTAETIIVREFMSFGSGSCDGEIVEFSGWYHAVIRTSFDAEGNVTGFTINDAESNLGTGTGVDSGDSYVRIYRSGSIARYGLGGGDAVVIHVTYLTRVLHLGPGGPADDLWIQSVFHYTLTPNGVEMTSEHLTEGCAAG